MSRAVQFWLGTLNLLFMGGGCWLAVSGLILLEDNSRMLPSRMISPELPNPLFYYVSLSLMVLGLVTSLIGLLGTVTVCRRQPKLCLQALYIFLLVCQLVVEGIVASVTLMCPAYLGLSLDKESMVDSWQRLYGIPGREPFTLAIDFIQTNCCGVEKGTEYLTSWWRLRDLAGPELEVPLTCCMQIADEGGGESYVDPMPSNRTLCQAHSAEEHRWARYTQGCYSGLNHWLQSHINASLTLLVSVFSYKLLLLMLAILYCLIRVKSKSFK